MQPFPAFGLRYVSAADIREIVAPQRSVGSMSRMHALRFVTPGNDNDRVDPMFVQGLRVVGELFRCVGAG